MSRFAERFMVLQEANDQLLDRVYFMLKEVPKLARFNQEKVAKFGQLVTRNFPETPQNVEKISGFDIVKQAHQDLYAELYRPYETILDLLEFKELALSLLLEVSKNTISLQFQDNAEYMIAFMNLFVGYAQLLILFGRVDNRKAVLAVFDQVIRIKTGTAERNYARLATFLQENENPLKRLQEDLGGLDSRVRETLLNLNTTFEKCNSVPILRKEGALSLLVAPDRLTLPIQDHYRFELVYLAKFQLWIIYGFIVCPRAITEESQGILKSVLSDGWVTPLYRDEVIYVHTEFEAIVEKFPNMPIKATKLKKLINEAAATAVQTSGTNHTQRRIYLKQEAHNVIHLIKDRPGLLGPKIQILFAALSLAKYEILWYFRHSANQPPKGKGKYSPEQYTDYLIAELIWLMEELSNLVTKHSMIIQVYYAEYLCGPDCDKIKDEFNSASKSGILDVVLSRMMNAIISELSKSLIEDLKSGHPISLKGLRMNWLRCISFLSSTQSAVRISKVKELVLKTQMAINHSRFVDNIEHSLREYSSLHELFYYRAQYESCFIGFLECYPMFSFSMVRHAKTFSLNITSALPEQQIADGNAVIDFTKTLIMHTCKYFSKCMKNIYEHTQRLNFQVSIDQTILLMRGDPTGKTPTIPGSESSGRIRPNTELDSMRRWGKNLFSLGSSFAQSREFIVYNRVIRPTKILHDYVVNYIVHWLRDTFFPSDGVLQKPSAILTCVSNMFYVLKVVERNACVDAQEIMNTAFAREFIHPSSETPQVIIEPVASKDKRDPLINSIAKWYNTMANSQSITFSPAKRTMIGTTEMGISSDLYATTYEIKALCQLIGPSGARYIDSVILQSIPEKLTQMKAILERNQDSLKEFARRFPSSISSAETLKKLKDLDSFMLISSQIGAALYMRTLFRDGIQLCVEENVPFFYYVTRDLAQQFSKSGFVEKESMLSECLAFDCGIKPKTIDIAVRALIVEFQKKTGNTAIWELLPVMYSFVLHCGLWQSGQYVEPLEAHTRNIHAIGITLYHMIVGFSSTRLAEDPESRAKAAESLGEFVRLATGQLLHIQTENMLPTELVELWTKYIFLYRFIGATQTESISSMNAKFPYTIVRGAYVHLQSFASDATRQQRQQVENEEVAE